MSVAITSRPGGQGRRLCVWLLSSIACLVAVAAFSLPAKAKPERIVSINLCTDQLLMQLVGPERIASLSFLSADPNISVIAEAARAFPLNHGLAEEILPINPDLVLAGLAASRPSVILLRRLGYEIRELPLAVTMPDVTARIMSVAQAVGEVERGRALADEFEARLAAARPPAGTRRPLAAVYWANGYTYGPGTLADSVVEAAGFENLARRLGITGIVQLPLETLVSLRPEFLIMAVTPGEAPALANEIMRHPALARAFDGAARLAVPDRLWNCGTPEVAAAVELLADLRRRHDAGAESGQ